MSRSVSGLIFIVGLVLFATAAPADDVDAISLDENSVASQLLEVKVYYESLCPDSKKFIRSKLYPAMINNGWLEFTDLKFVPYGKVKRVFNPKTQETTLNCQHGVSECELNAMHACIVEQNNIAEQTEMINCMMSSLFSNTDVDTCASNLNINVNDAKQCKNTRSTPDILEKYGEDTDSIDITFVPSIALDGEFVREDQKEILDNFSGIFCRKYNEKYGVKLPNCN